MDFAIRRIEDRKDLRTFIRVPYRLYRDSPVWVPPLFIEAKKEHAQQMGFREAKKYRGYEMAIPSG